MSHVALVTGWSPHRYTNEGVVLMVASYDKFMWGAVHRGASVHPHRKSFPIPFLRDPIVQPRGALRRYCTSSYHYAEPDETYTYFEVDPPTDRRLQCACEHTLRSSDIDAAPAGGHSSNEMEGDDDKDMYTLRCTNVVGVRDCALGWRLCMACRPSEEIIQDRVYAVFIAAYDYVEEYDMTLNPRLHFGRLQVRTRVRLRQLGGKCQCMCWTCDTPGNRHRGVRDFTHQAYEMACIDVNSFIAGELPELAVENN